MEGRGGDMEGKGRGRGGRGDRREANLRAVLKQAERANHGLGRGELVRGTQRHRNPRDAPKLAQDLDQRLHLHQVRDRLAREQVRRCQEQALDPPPAASGPVQGCSAGAGSDHTYRATHHPRKRRVCSTANTAVADGRALRSVWAGARGARTARTGHWCATHVMLCVLNRTQAAAGFYRWKVTSDSTVVPAGYLPWYSDPSCSVAPSSRSRCGQARHARVAARFTAESGHVRLVG